MTAWERREGLKRVFVDGGSCFDPISGSTAAQDTLLTVNAPSTLIPAHPIGVIWFCNKQPSKMNQCPNQYFTMFSAGLLRIDWDRFGNSASSEARGVISSSNQNPV